MSKKKASRDATCDESTESCDENSNETDCPHIAKAVDLQRVKKSLIKSGFLVDCEQCKMEPNTIDTIPGIEFDMTLWLCLRCGNQACGRMRNMHAIQHFNTPHSDCHCLCVNTNQWTVWCYVCDEEVNATCRKKLLEIVDYLRKQSESTKSKMDYKQSPIVIVPKLSHESGSNYQSGVIRPRGLMNLGNTCFFNSVVQCLGQTPYLLDLLDATSEPGQYFKLPGGKLEISDNEFIIVDPLEGHLEKWRNLPASLAETLKQLRNGRGEVFVPRALLQGFTNKMPQFGGGDQHDSHELLRHLLEAVREADLRRYQSVILEKLGFNKKTDPATVEGDKKKIVKFYGQQTSEMLLPTEQVFRGTLVSTLQCQDCQHTSRRDEYFLDLSLPISEKQLPPVLRRKAEEIEDKPSKHQIKKEKRAERKKNKKQKAQKANNLNANNAEKSESESDADIEDNGEDLAMQNAVDAIFRGVESGYNSDKVDNSSPDANNRGESPDMRVDDSGVPSPAIGMLSVSPVSPDNSPTYSEANIDMGSPICGHNSPNEEANEDFERPESRLSFVNNKNTDLKMDLAKLSLLNDGDSQKVNSLYDNKMEDGSFEGACGGLSLKDEKMEEDNEDEDLWSGTMSARYQCEEGEYSVQSCLNQFTACELMTGNNKVSCELCTKRHGGAAKKTVYTNATKQLLIYNPPAVLILHLKRFQVYRFRSAKVSKFVKFPILLDLAPFCSKRAQNLPTFETGQTKVLYSLYGVVEHSGSIHGGHYVAYVKVRPELEENSYRWQFLPKNQKSERSEGSIKGALGDPQVPTGKWYYISDSHVTEVPESKVLGAQAYLLFYERIL